MQTMGSAGLSAEIKIENPLERSVVADLGVAAMSGVIRAQIDVENLAIQLISDSARYAVQQSHANSVSDEYHQSQRASRGKGHITQTTVDQQWESHLINDAEFYEKISYQIRLKLFINNPVKLHKTTYQIIINVLYKFKNNE